MIKSGDPLNYVKIADNLKGLTDNALKTELQKPNTFAPSVMIIGELNYRQKLREKYPGDPQSTVAQDTVNASKVYQGQDALTGIMAGDSSSYFNPKLASAEGGIVDYNEGGIVGYNEGKLVGFEEDEIAELLKGNLPPRTIASGQGRQRITNPKYQQAVDYLASERKRLGDTRNVGSDPSASFFGIGQQNPFPQVKGQKVGRTRVTSTNPEFGSEFAELKPSKDEKNFFQKMFNADEYDKTTMDAFNLGLKAPVKGTGTTQRSLEQIRKDAVEQYLKSQGKDTTKLSPMEELLKQEYLMRKKAYEEQKALPSQRLKKAAIRGGLGLALTGNLAQAGIEGLDAFQGEKDRQRKILTGLGKDRFDAAKSYALSGLEREKIGISRADLRRKAYKDWKDLQWKIKKAKNDEERNIYRLAGDIMESNPQTTLQQAMNQIFQMQGGTQKPISLSDTRQYELG